MIRHRKIRRITVCGSTVSLIIWPHGESWRKSWWERPCFLCLWLLFWWFLMIGKKWGISKPYFNDLDWMESKTVFEEDFPWILLILCRRVSLLLHSSFSPLFSGFSWNSLSVIKNICLVRRINIQCTPPLLLYHCVVMPAPPTVWSQKRGILSWEYAGVGCLVTWVCKCLCVFHRPELHMLFSQMWVFWKCGYNEYEWIVLYSMFFSLYPSVFDCIGSLP